MFFAGLFLFNYKDEFDEKIGDVGGALKGQLDELGPMTKAEKKAAVIFLFTLLSWATGDYQKDWFGFELSTEQTAVLSMLLCLLPGIGVINWKQADIKWDLMIFSAGAYAVGNAVNDTGGASWVIDKLINATGLDLLPPSVVAVALIFITIFSHLIFTSKTVRTTILIPSIIVLAKQLGIDPVPLALACSYGISYTITLPPHSKVNTLYFGTGYFDVKDELIYGLITCFFGAVAISLVYFVWLNVVL
jgi:di/tricarboxylate transporter